MVQCLVGVSVTALTKGIKLLLKDLDYIRLELLCMKHVHSIASVISAISFNIQFLLLGD